MKETELSGKSYQWLIAVALLVIGLLAGVASSYTRLDGRVVRNTTMIRVQDKKLDKISNQLDVLNGNILEISKSLAALEEAR